MMKRYTEYKESGVEWLGEIPKHWEIIKISHAFSHIGSGTTPRAGSPEYYENGTIKWVNTGDLNDGIIFDCAKTVTQKAIDDFSSLKIHKKGSLVIALYGATIGKVAIMNFDACANQACCVLNESNTHLMNFAFYWFLANKQNIISLSFGGGQPNISQDIIRNLRITTPPKEEQTAIASFLDQKTSQIDSLISNKKRMIDLLKEERAAIINHAVTKGINPDAEMKDSGVEWLGEVPKHWEVKRLKQITDKITDGEHISPDFIDEGIPFLSAKDIRERTINFDTNKFVSLENANKFWNRCKPSEGDILIVSRGATIGRVGLVECKKDFCLLGSVILIRLNPRNLPFFLFFALNNSKIQEGFLLASQSSAQQAIYLVNIAETVIPSPPFDEQKLIATYLDKKTSQIDSSISHIEKEISLIEEYRTTLINETVTGKIDVRDLV